MQCMSSLLFLLRSTEICQAVCTEKEKSSFQIIVSILELDSGPLAVPLKIPKIYHQTACLWSASILEPEVPFFAALSPYATPEYPHRTYQTFEYVSVLKLKPLFSVMMVPKICGNPPCTTDCSERMQVCASCRARTYCVSLSTHIKLHQGP